MLDATILMEEDEESLNQTNILYRYGVGVQKVQGRENQGLKGQRTVTRWSFVNAQEGRRGSVLHDRFHYFY